MLQILLVEDDARTLRLMRLALRPLGYMVYEATTRAAALAALAELTPDVVVLDIRLPDMSGIEVARAIRRHRRFAETVIVAMTGCAMPGDGERFLAAGCSGYVTKPIDAHIFPAIIASYLDSR